MEYYTVDKFNRGFRPSEGSGGGGVGMEEVRDYLDEKIVQLRTDFKHDAGNIFRIAKTQLGKETQALVSRVDAIEKIGQLYTVTNTYFSTKGRRIVSAAKAIDKTDVIVKEQLDDAMDKTNKNIDKINKKIDKKIDKIDKRIDKFDKKIDDHINFFESYKGHVNTELNNLLISDKANKEAIALLKPNPIPTTTAKNTNS